MKLDPKDVILRRLGHELAGERLVALGSGIPDLVKPILAESIRTVSMSANGAENVPVDVAVVEALEISSQGDVVIAPSFEGGAVQAKKWIAVTLHNGLEGEPKLVKKCRGENLLPGRVGLVITELGVIEVNSVGLVLREVAPGVATDDVRLRTQASLHVADDIRLMEL